MLFNTFEFFSFFLIFLAIFFTVPKRGQPVVLLIASYIFYMGWKASFALLLAFTTLVDYFTALAMERANTAAGRKLAMLTALTINLGILSIVKYFDFVMGNLSVAAGWFDWSLPHVALNLVLPVGISFYTFQSIGYTLDVYNRRVPAERHFLTYAQYVAFFPQLVAGPIERAAHMLPQFRRRHWFRLENLGPGLWLIGYGLFKKICVADAVAPVVGAIYARPDSYPGAYNLLATLFFTFQIYADFSGYSDIARGVAKIMDFDLMVNFRQPYFSTSMTEFWRRWHISLSSWFRDYLYFPLGGARGRERVVVRNLMIVFLVSGLWHGPAWTYICWGGLHGLTLVVERALRRMFPAAEIRSRLWFALLGWTVTMSIAVAGWVFFRASSLSNALAVFRSLGNFGHLSYGTFKVLGLSSFEILTLGLSFALLLVVDACIVFRPQLLGAWSRRRVAATAMGVAFTYFLLLFGVLGRHEFIYFQF